MTEAAAVYVDPATLTPWSQNPRNNEEAIAKVARSIERFGFASPIVARTADGRIIAGHTRHAAAMSLGLRDVPVRFLDIDEQKASALALADNRLGEIATWDDEGLAAILEGLAAEDVDLDGLGWDEDELDGLLDSLGTVEPDGTEDDVPEVAQGEPDSAQGEVYELGPHRLMCGDCRDPASVAELLEEVRVNVAFTSPPYASQRKYDESSGFKPIKPDAYVEWFEAVQANVREHLAEDGSWFVNIKAHCEDGQRHLYVMDLVLRHAREWGWRFVDDLVWRHHGFPGEVFDRFRNAHEPIFHFAVGARAKCRPDHVAYQSDAVMKYSTESRESMTHTAHNDGPKSAERSAGMAYPRNVLELPNGAGTSIKGHAATFPVGLPDFFVRAFSDASDIIFDPFLGSGTTLIAAAQNDRIGYGMELSPAYCDVIRRRWTAWARKRGRDPGPGALDPIEEVPDGQTD
jgi:DNA modification methylase